MVSITIEIPDDLAQQLEAAGLLEPAEFVKAAIARLENRSEKPKYSDHEIENLLDEGQGILADSTWTMDDVLQMKREEWALEEKRINRS